MGIRSGQEDRYSLVLLSSLATNFQVPRAHAYTIIPNFSVAFEH